MVGLLTYLPTTAYFPQFFFLLAFVYIVIRERTVLLDSFSKFRIDPIHPLNWNFLIILLIIGFSSINRLIHWDSIPSFAGLFPYFILLIPTYFIARGFKKEDAKILVGFILAEALVVLIESYYGVSTFDESLAGFKVFEEGSMAYSQRPLGISESSSHIASKLFLAWLMIDFFKFKSKLWWLVKLTLLGAIISTFNRSVLLSLGVFVGLYYLVKFWSLKYKLENAIVGLVAGIIGASGLITVLILKGRFIIGQLTRDTGTVELTGREYLWIDFLAFIKEHLIFGNNSVKLWMDGYHAHNSYIEVIATNGVFISMLYFALIYRNIRKSNWFYVVPILVYGLTQYGFFWGISLMDILFYVILFQVTPKDDTTLNPLPIELTLSGKQ